MTCTRYTTSWCYLSQPTERHSGDDVAAMEAAAGGQAGQCMPVAARALLEADLARGNTVI